MARPNGDYRLSRLRDSKVFTKDQIQQHKQVRDQLQKANAFAGQELRTLRALSADQERTGHVYADLANVVRWMNLLLGCCEQIVDNAFQQRFTRIEVIFGTTCEHCENTARSADGSGGQGYVGTLGVDPAWSVHVKYLLSLTTSTIYRTYAGSSLSEFKEPHRCLADMTKALGRQQRHLERMGGKRAPEIAVIFDHSEVCSKCGHRNRGGPLVDGDDDDDNPTTELT